MTDHELETKLARAAFHAAPNDLEGVLSRCETQKGTVITMKESKPRKNRYLAMAACMALLLAGGSGLVWQQANAVSSVVSLDVNPSIELKVNKKEKVLNCGALNEDGQVVLAEMSGGSDLKGTKVDVAVNALVGSLVRHGYLEDLSSAILISVEDKDSQRAAKLEEQLTASVDEALQQKGSQATVIGQVVQGSGKQTEGLSNGKAAVVEKLVDMNPQLSFDALAELSVEELYHMGTTGAKAMPVGKSAALAAVLQYAGVSDPSQLLTHVDPELDEVPAVYEVELYHPVLGSWSMRWMPTPARWSLA